ncbi:FAD-binding oxidoreductase [Parasphingopyxis marina]|uniref:FAD-binding oxidoreductase n=1 Tax=Parasphingopyxis marina TaxID=2761622 RepID=A0A842I0S8_9SPHN|nr:FAD-binding oxidoreductase [Parasphingopyxis marina]MBC2779126.1 FAD-binding oxidoreductase [Parasphingopyxis marina]
MAECKPAWLSATQFERGLAAFEAVLDAEGFHPTPTAAAEFRDPFAPSDWQDFLPSAALQPNSVEQVQAIVRLANEHKIPLWTSSQGRNNGYGGAAPRIAGSVVLNLRRLNRVIDIDEESAFALIEPGVRFFDLYDAIQTSGAKLWMSVPDLGWGSVIGNTCDHGVGYTPTGDHVAHQCGMEVVLPDGSLLRTGMGAMQGNKAWQVHKRGFGPSLDGIFMQSSLGIVTKMGVWLMPRPECYMPGWLTVGKEEDFPAMIDALRPLLIEGVIPNQPMIYNAVCAASAVTERKDWYEGKDPMPDTVIDRIAEQPGLGRWVMRFALYGRDGIIDRQREIVEQAFAHISSIAISFNKYDAANLPELENPHERVQAGIPSNDLNQMTKWYGGEEGGHIGFSSVLPVTGRDMATLRDLVRAKLEAKGLDYSAACIASGRTLIHVALVVFDMKDAEQTQAAYDACKALVEPAAKLGFGEYRAHLDFMDLVADQYDFGGHASRRVHETLKDALDPNGILAPGKQGIWPAALRDPAARNK